MFSVHASLFSLAQSCNSLRYQDTIFHHVTISTAKFGTATPYGLLAQPQDLYLDFYEPTGDTLTKRPLIVFQFGGGFTIGWRSEPVIPQFCDYFAKCGYTVATIDYRIGLNAADMNSTVRAYYRGVQDERSAIRFLCQRAQQYRFDTSLIILTGTSAGCFCAFANAFTNDAERPAASFGSVLEPTDLGCMDCSGNNDFGRHIPRIKAIINQWGAILDTTYIEASENTPVISFHGDQDILVPYVSGYPFQLPVFPVVYGSVPIHQRLNNVGILNEFHPLVGYGHEPELLAPHLNDTIYKYSREFLFELLRPHTSDIVGDTLICAGTLANYSVTNTSGSKYCWTIYGSGNIVADNNNSITVLWNDTGTVSVNVKELNYIAAEGEEKIFQTEVIPHVASSFNLAVNELHASFTNLSSGATGYQWDFGDATTSTDSNPVPKEYISGGTYTIELIAANSACADTFSQTITIDSCPVAHITYQLTNRNAFFYTPATNAVSYSWNFGDSDSASVNYPNVFHQYTQDGQYIIILKVENALGCEDADTLLLTVAVTSVDNFDADKIFIASDGNGLRVNGLSFDANETYHAEIFDVRGRRIASGMLSNSNDKLQTENYLPGIYLLKISNAEKTILKKFTTSR